MKNTLTDMYEMVEHLQMTSESDEEFTTGVLEHLAFLSTPLTYGNLDFFFEKNARDQNDGVTKELFRLIHPCDQDEANCTEWSLHIRNIDSQGKATSFTTVHHDSNMTFNDIVSDFHFLPKGEQEKTKYERSVENYINKLSEREVKEIGDLLSSSKPIHFNQAGEEKEEEEEGINLPTDSYNAIKGIGDMGFMPEEFEEDGKDDEEYIGLICDGNECGKTEIIVPMWMLPDMMAVRCNHCDDTLLTREEFLRIKERWLVTQVPKGLRQYSFTEEEIHTLFPAESQKDKSEDMAKAITSMRSKSDNPSIH